jgi:hypothetical protein
MLIPLTSLSGSTLARTLSVPAAVVILPLKLIIVYWKTKGNPRCSFDARIYRFGIEHLLSNAADGDLSTIRSIILKWVI